MRASPLDDKKAIYGGKKKGRDKAMVKERKMKDWLSSNLAMLRDDTNSFYEQQQKTPDYGLIANPVDSPSSVHLKQRLASFSIFNEVCRLNFISSHRIFLSSSKKMIR